MSKYLDFIIKILLVAGLVWVISNVVKVKNATPEIASQVIQQMGPVIMDLTSKSDSELIALKKQLESLTHQNEVLNNKMSLFQRMFNQLSLSLPQYLIKDTVFANKTDSLFLPYYIKYDVSSGLFKWSGIKGDWLGGGAQKLRWYNSFTGKSTPKGFLLEQKRFPLHYGIGAEAGIKSDMKPFANVNGYLFWDRVYISPGVGFPWGWKVGLGALYLR